jgi:methyl-accepting chemotaxis protein
MTIKRKIIAGFVAMIIILAGVAVIGYRGLNVASDLFLEFSRIANLNVASSDAAAGIGESAYYLEKFMRQSDGKDMELSIAAQENTLAAVRLALENIITPERTQKMQHAAARLEEYLKAHGQIQSLLVPWYGDYQRIVIPSFAKAGKSLGELGDTALQVNNSSILGQINDIWRLLSNLDAALADFRARGSEDSAAAVDALLAQAQARNEQFGASLTTDRGKSAFSEYQTQYEAIERTFQKHRAPAIRVAEILEQAYSWDDELEDIVKTMSAQSQVEQDRRQAEIIAANGASSKFMLASSGAGLVVGAVFAVFIIVGLISILRRVSEFAGAVAEGDFDRDPGIREKGEIGNMVAAIQQIPRTLKGILADYLNLEKAIETGAISRKADAGKYHGGFSVLVNGTNSILARLNMVIDNIPSPVVVLNKDARIEYLNEAARTVAGSDFQGKTCKQVFNRDDDGTETDALRKAMATKRPAGGETKAHPGGTEMDVSYMAIPMFDKEGDLSSLLQLLTDLTAVKTQQRKILRVASQASEISNQVAAASEELSAQVEQVSRGAEIQRSRVESTASAMTEMNSTVLEVARNAGQASEQSNLTHVKANSGSDLVNQLVQAINEVNKVASTLQSNMQSLGSQAESIGGVMTVISDIADQTNLLALNAAIEAARAGEAGRGFAVVADEVRKLAEKTMSATQEVSSSINAIQHSTHINVEEVDNAVRSIGTATDLADASGKALAEILDLATTNSTVVASIATAAEEQSATSEEINRAIEEINQVVGDTTTGMMESSAAVQKLSHMAQELRQVMEELS